MRSGRSEESYKKLPIKMNAGILPYSLRKKTLYFLLGRDVVHQTPMWSSFGGKYEKGETPEMTASREANEETGKWVKDFQPEEVMGTPSFQTPNFRLYFVEVDYLPVETEEYYRALSEIQDGEIDKMTWVPGIFLVSLLQHGRDEYPGLVYKLRSSLVKSIVGQQTIINNDCGLQMNKQLTPLEWLDKFIQMKETRLRWSQSDE
jgi:ADP-ribose pyrophosphatase YjhB (NUDIX family)